MLSISPANTLSVQVNQASCSVSLFGCEIVSGVPQYKTLAYMNPIATVGAWVTLYTPAAGRTAMISHLMIGNGSSTTAYCYIGSGGGSYIGPYGVAIPAGGFVSWDAFRINLYDANAARL